MAERKEGAPDTIFLRPMRYADLARVVELEEQIYTDPWSMESFEEIVRESYWQSVVAQEGGSDEQGTVVGYACWYIAADEFHIGNIAVAPECRRKGVARRMLEHMFAVARRSPAEKMYLEVRLSNEAARRFYVKNGFAEGYRRRGYYTDPVEDAIVMWRPVDLPE